MVPVDKVNATTVMKFEICWIRVPTGTNLRNGLHKTLSITAQEELQVIIYII